MLILNPVHDQHDDSDLTQVALGLTKFMDWNTGAGEGIRTLDPDLGKVVLYP
jgi:hypothetical protein